MPRGTTTNRSVERTRRKKMQRRTWRSNAIKLLISRYEESTKLSQMLMLMSTACDMNQIGTKANDRLSQQFMKNMPKK